VSRGRVSRPNAKVRHRRATAERLSLLRIDSRSAVDLNESFEDFAFAVKAPPLLVSFPSTKQYLRALPDDLCATHGMTIAELVSRGFPPVVSIRCLGILFGYSSKFIGAIYRQTERYYREFYIPKGSQKRVIHAPRVALKVIQKWFGEHVANALSFDDTVFGFVRGRSAVQGAAVHCGAKWIYSIDIENFFPSTPESLVTRALGELGYPQHGAELISKLCCYKGNLAQGSPASPVISNLVFKEVDQDLRDLAARHGVRYTRYADDLVFSGVGSMPQKVPHEVRVKVASHGWTISEGKEHYAERPQRLKVYGLLVHGEKPRLTKGYRNRIRAYQHLLDTGKVKPDDVARVLGHLAYARSVGTLADE
jgi:retron-type reverse transcriptase